MYICHAKVIYLQLLFELNKFLGEAAKKEKVLLLMAGQPPPPLYMHFSYYLHVMLIKFINSIYPDDCFDSSSFRLTNSLGSSRQES